MIKKILLFWYFGISPHVSYIDVSQVHKYQRYPLYRLLPSGARLRRTTMIQVSLIHAEESDISLTIPPAHVRS